MTLLHSSVHNGRVRQLSEMVQRSVLGQIDNKQTLRPPMPQRGDAMVGALGRCLGASCERRKIKMGGACSRPKHGTCSVVVEALVLLIGRSTATLTNPRNATLRQSGRSKLCTCCAAKHEKSCESHVSISCDEEALSQEGIFVQEHRSGLSRVLVKLHLWLAARRSKWKRERRNRTDWLL